MLKGISPLLTPELLHTLASMGHGDKLAIVDQNYPSASSAKLVHHLSGADTWSTARAILSVFPIDTFDEPAVWSITPAGRPDAVIESHGEFQTELNRAEGRRVTVQPLERLDFYALARTCFAIVQTGEPRGFSCFVLTKGVL